MKQGSPKKDFRTERGSAIVCLFFERLFIDQAFVFFKIKRKDKMNTFINPLV